MQLFSIDLVLLHPASARGMPAFGGRSDAEVAAIATYIRTSWGNSYPAVTSEQVARLR